MNSSGTGCREFRLGIKRAFDIAVAGAGLLVLSPVAGLVAWQVRKQMGSPVIFRQMRPGLHGQPFEVMKFRTMTSATEDDHGNPLGDAERTPPLGFFLRKVSLDEIPQLVSVLKGDMSLVGPRPLLMHYLDQYTDEQARRHDMRPGITGWAQVNGRQNLLFSERFRLDVWYIDNWDLRLDLKILLMTVLRVLRSRGVITGQDVRDVDDVGFNKPIQMGT